MTDDGRPGQERRIENRTGARMKERQKRREGEGRREKRKLKRG